MGGFFIPGIGAGGGGGGNLPANVITGVQLNPAQNGLTFTYSTGATTDIPLNDVVENLTASQIENVRLNGKTLVVEQVDGQQTTIALTNVLDAVDINFTPTGNIQSTNVQDAIVEISGKVSGAYVNSDFDSQTGILTLIKEDGTRDPHEFGKGLIKNVTYDIQTQMLNIETVDGQMLTADLTDLASKTLDNVFTGNNTFKDINLGLPGNIVAPWVGGTHHGGAPNPIKIGDRSISSHANASNGYVKNLVTRVADNIQLDTPFNVNVWEVTKGQDRNNDMPKQLYSNLELKVVEGSKYWNQSYTRALVCPINKKYDKDTYFIYQLTVGNALFRISGATANDDYIFLGQNDDVTQQNIGSSQNTFATQCALEQGEVNISDLINGIDISGVVKRVNGQTPNQQGDVVVSSEHIRYDNTTSNLVATNVQEAIEEVNGKTITAGAINGNNIVLTQENGNQINVDVTRLIGINTINTESPDAQGNIDLALAVDGDNLEFKVKDNVKNTLELYTDADANTLIQYFV